MTEPRAYTVEEVREMLLNQLVSYRNYWESLPDKSSIDKLDGLCFGFLNILDGTSSGLPAFDLSPSPHEDDKDFLIGQGENYFEKGQVVNDTMLHELWHSKGYAVNTKGGDNVSVTPPSNSKWNHARMWDGEKLVDTWNGDSTRHAPPTPRRPA